MIQYLDAFKDRFGVEPICRILGATECGFLTARGHRAAKTRLASARALRDEFLGAEIIRLHAENYGVYGVRTMHALMHRQGWAIGRDQTGRIMRSVGVRGVKRSKEVFTTRPDPAGERPHDPVQRRFTATAPRLVVGWNVAATLKAEILPLQALDMADWDASHNLAELTRHSNHGSNYMSIVYTDRIIELGAKPSTGTGGDSTKYSRRSRQRAL